MHLGADVAVLPDWSGEAVTCLAFSPDGSLLAAGGAQGSVRVWQLEPTGGEAGPRLRAATSALLPTSGGSGAAGVGAVRWLPGAGADGWVLLAGNRNNSSLGLWHAPAAAPGSWTKVQSFSFDGKDGASEFFNNVGVVAQARLVVAADAARKAVYTLHYSGEPSSSTTVVALGAPGFGCTGRCARLHVASAPTPAADDRPLNPCLLWPLPPPPWQARAPTPPSITWLASAWRSPSCPSPPPGPRTAARAAAPTAPTPARAAARRWS